jgi:uncharacterized phage protein gp47/JayE
MADVTTRTFTQLLQGIAAAVQGRASGLVDFTAGSIARAVSEAFSGVQLWVQANILALLVSTRASATVQAGQSADLDSWVADWGAAPTADDETLIERFAAAGASGNVTFSRLTTTGQAVVPVGSTVATQDGSQVYVVQLDALNPAYNAGLGGPDGGYVMAGGTGTVTVKVAAKIGGAASNAVAGAVNTITSAIAGVDAVTNASAFTNGLDAEKDEELLKRFRLFVAALRKGNDDAIVYAVQSLQRGVSAKVVGRQLHDGTPKAAYFYVVVDDGTGNPSSDLLTAAGAAVDAVHGSGIEFAVYAPTVTNVSITAALTTQAGANHATAIAAATEALAAYLNTLPIGGTVYWSRLWQVIHDASPDIVEVTGLLANGGVVDITFPVYGVAKAGTLTIS